MAQKLVFIDGENFRQNLITSLLNLNLIESRNTPFQYDIRGLIEELIGENVAINYYATSIRLPKLFAPSEEIANSIKNIQETSRRWKSMLLKQDINYIKAGNLKVKESKKCPKCHKISEILEEKGVDVRVALDIFESSLEHKNAEIFTMSSDTDICPAYQKIRNKGKKITYICFPDLISVAVKKSTTTTIIIPPTTIAKYFIHL